MRYLLTPLILAILTASASAHTVSIGYENNGPGSVSFWYGSYHATSNEGSLNLVGINGNPFPSTTIAFDLLTFTKPAGLVDGVNNFYTDGAGGLTGTPFSSTVNGWQGVSFNGLAPGDYVFTYIPIANPSANWAPWDNGILSNTVTLTAQDVGMVPEPASLAVWGIGAAVLGIGARRRRKLA